MITKGKIARARKWIQKHSGEKLPPDAPISVIRSAVEDIIFLPHEKPSALKAALYGEFKTEVIDAKNRRSKNE